MRRLPSFVVYNSEYKVYTKKFNGRYWISVGRRRRRRSKDYLFGQPTISLGPVENRLTNEGASRSICFLLRRQRRAFVVLVGCGKSFMYCTLSSSFCYTALLSSVFVLPLGFYFLSHLFLVGRRNQLMNHSFDQF